MSGLQAKGSGELDNIEFVDVSWDVPQIYRADPLLPPFFAALKQKRLLAAKAPGQGGRVIFPPTSFCEITYTELKDLTELKPLGTIRTFTVMPSTPSPKIIVFVQLEGADTASPGYLRGALDDDL